MICSGYCTIALCDHTHAQPFDRFVAEDGVAFMLTVLLRFA